MFSKEFIDIVNVSVGSSRDYYSDNNNLNKPNPFYIGFGNPNADVLILGKEKGFEQDNEEQLKFESIKNPFEWSCNVENGIKPHKTKYYKDSRFYLNAYFPYDGKMRSGHTWTKYNNLIQKFHEVDTSDNNDFLRQSFISEINHEPSKYSKINKFTSQTRLTFLKHAFFKTFKKTILACGNYLSKNEIEDIFDVQFYADMSSPREKLLIFINGRRTIVNTRQLSMDVKTDYIERIVEQLKIVK